MDATTTQRTMRGYLSRKASGTHSSKDVDYVDMDVDHKTIASPPDLVYSSEDSASSACSRTHPHQSQLQDLQSKGCHPDVVSFQNKPKPAVAENGNAHTTARPRRRRSSGSVSFSTIQVNYYDLALGDNPSCSPTGPPLTICWQPNARRTYDIDAFERKRVGRRRSEHDLKIDALSRHNILRWSGEHSYTEIFERMDEMEKIRIQRRRTFAMVRIWTWLTKFFTGNNGSRKSRQR